MLLRKFSSLSQIAISIAHPFALIFIVTRNKNATKTNNLVEMGLDSNDVRTTDAIRSIFQEMFQKHEKVPIETVNSASLVTNQRIDKLPSDITINNEKLTKLANNISDVQLSIEAS